MERVQLLCTSLQQHRHRGVIIHHLSQQLCPFLFKQRTFSGSRQEPGKSNVGRQQMLQLASRLLSNVHECVFWRSSRWCPKRNNRRNDSRSIGFGNRLNCPLVGLPIFKHTPVGVENLQQTRTSMWSPLTQKTIWGWWPDKLTQSLKASFKIKDYIKRGIKDSWAAHRGSPLFILAVGGYRMVWFSSISTTHLVFMSFSR